MLENFTGHVGRTLYVVLVVLSYELIMSIRR